MYKTYITYSMEKGYTNLIKNLFVNRSNRVWCADITYVRQFMSDEFIRLFEEVYYGTVEKQV